MSRDKIPVQEQGRVRIPKTTRAGSLKPCDLSKIRAALQGAGITLRSGELSYHLSLELLGADSPAGVAVFNEYGSRKKDFLEFISGTSEQHLIKVLYEAASLNYISEFLRVCEKLTGQVFDEALEPDYLGAYKEQQQRINAISKALLQGRAGDVGVSRDLWKEGSGSVGKPERAKSQEIIFQRTQSRSPVEQYEVLWLRKENPVPVGQVFLLAQRYSLLLDGRPYTYTGRPCKIGKKNLLLVTMSAKVKADIKRLVASRFRDKLAS